ESAGALDAGVGTGAAFACALSDGAAPLASTCAFALGLTAAGVRGSCPGSRAQPMSTRTAHAVIRTSSNGLVRDNTRRHGSPATPPERAPTITASAAA